MNLHIVGPAYSTLVRSVRLYCEEKGLTYTHGMSLNGRPINWRSDDHLAIHPFGKVPVLFHGDTSIFETTAIFRYLDAVYPERRPPLSLATETVIDQWTSALVTSVDASLVRAYIVPLAGPNRPVTIDAQTLAAAQLAAERTLAVLEVQLGEQPFICGARWTMADALLTPMLDYLALITEPASLLSERPRLTAYLDRMRSRAAGQVVLRNPASA